MHYSVFMEDYLEFEDWHDQDNEEVNFNDSSSEERLIGKLQSEDHYFRKQGLNDLLSFLQQNTHIDIFPTVFQAVRRFATDNEPSLRSDFAESLITITQIGISKTLSQWHCVEDFTVPSVVSLLHDTNKQIRLASHSTIIFLLENKFLTKEVFFAEIYPTLEEMMVSYNPDELRTECFTLLVQVSQLLQNCLEENMLTFCRDFIGTNDNLRKTCASYLLSIINGSSDKHLNDWLEIFYKLSDDNSWYVKKFCIECAVSLSKRLTREERWSKMTNVYFNFMTDSKKWVATCAYQNFGAFIATFADPAKAQCELSEHNHVITVPPPPKTSSFQPPSQRNSNFESTPLSDSDSSSFSSVCFWQQPIDDSLIQQLSPVSLSIRDIDLNQSDSSNELTPYCWPPDLSKYKQDIVPQKLLQTFSNVVHEGVDVDMIRPCAYSIPAVLVTLGPSCWPYLKAAYTKLVQFMSWKVRLSLAASLHHVFHIFRYNQGAVDDIVSAYKEFIKDVDEVKCGLVTHISEFYLALDVARYPSIFDDFDDLVHLDSAKNWRYRVTCMEQLQALIAGVQVRSDNDKSVFVDMLATRWLPVVFAFAEDHVWVVRSAAVDVMIATLKKLITKESATDAQYDKVVKLVEDKIVQYSESSTWYLRQLFLASAVKIVTGDVLPVSRVDSIIMPKYLYLCCWDGVPNNRMVGGQGLECLCSHSYFTTTSADSRKMIENVYHQLNSDKDRDVRQSVERLSAIFVTVVQ